MFQDGVSGRCGVTGDVGSLALISMCSTLCKTSPHPGDLSFKSALVSTQSALPVVQQIIY